MSNSFVTRAYNQFEILPYGQIKKSSKSDRLIDEIDYYIQIRRDTFPDISILFPRLISWSWDTDADKTTSMIIERYDYDTLGQYMINDDLNTYKCDYAMNQLSNILRVFKTYVDPEPSNESYIIDMVLHKTTREYNALVQSRLDLLPLFESPHIILNNRLLKNFTSMQTELVDYVMNNMLDYTSTIIHGDMCFSNILYSPKTDIIRFIDPRGLFGKKGIYGDQRYDVAKLMHSVDGGYEFFINDRFRIVSDDTKSNWSLVFVDADDNPYITTNNEKSYALKAFESKFFDTGKFKKKDIMIIAGTIFIGMCARHYDSTTRQEAMYLTGVRLLNEALSL